MLQLHRWSLIKEKKAVAMEEAEELKKMSEKLRKWAIHVQSYNVIVKIY